MGFFDDIGAAIGNVAATVTNAITPKSTGGSTPSTSSAGNLTYKGTSYNGALDLFNKSIGASVGNVASSGNAVSTALSDAGNAASAFLSGVGSNAGTIIKTGASLLPPIVAANAVSKLFSGSSGHATTAETTTNPTTTATTSNWNPTYYAVDQSGTQSTQTWKNANSGVQTAFANISASALSEYFAERGDTSSANMYAQIAAASKGNSIVNTKSAGYMYDAMSGTAYSVSDRYAKNPVVTEYLTAKDGASQQNTAAKTETPWTNINLYDSFVEVKQDAYTNAMLQVYNGNILSGDVAIGAGAMAADVLAPLDLVNVGNKLLTGRGNELEGSDYAMAALDALAIVGGVFSFGTGYVAIKGLKTAAKVAKVGSTVGQVGSIGAGGVGAAMILGGE